MERSHRAVTGTPMRTKPKKGLYILPNLFTVSSIFCGFLAIVKAFEAQSAAGIQTAALLVGLGMVLDLFDGRVARLTNTQSDFGVQLDSLADLVSFGVAPGVILYQFGLQSLGAFGVVAAFVFVACGALRLARFNVSAAEDGGSSCHFQGLPIPAAAGVAMSFVLVMSGLDYARLPSAAVLPSALMMLALGGLMVSSIKYKTFKKVRVTPHEQLLLVGTGGAFAVLTLSFSFAVALASALAFYVAIGLVGAVLSVTRTGLRTLRTATAGAGRDAD